MFRPNLAGAGRYDVYYYNFNHGQGATNTPVTITHSGGAANVTVNHRGKPTGWLLLGTYEFPAGKGAEVKVSNGNTDGFVFADAIKLAPAAAAKN